MSSTKRSSPARIGIAERTDSKGAKQYRGTAYDSRAGRHLRGPWTSSLAEARSWRVDALASLQAGTLSADRGPTVEEAVQAFVAGIADGTILSRSGRPYKPGPASEYTRELKRRIVPAFGARRLSEVTLPDVQRFADTIAATGLAPSTVRNVMNALRALYAWALPRGMAKINPTRGLRLPTGETPRDRIAAPAEAANLIAALAPEIQAALGLAVYGGLRLGELLALRWEDVDLEARTLRVERSWDHNARRFVEPKSKAGKRTVPIVERLAVLLADHRVLCNQATGGLLLRGDEPGNPLHPTTLRERVSKAWRKAGLKPLGFHEARHTAASIFIASGLNAKTVSTYLGHASITITLDRYGHLFPGSEAEALGLLNAFLAR
jgi:integrase